MVFAFWRRAYHHRHHTRVALLPRGCFCPSPFRLRLGSLPLTCVYKPISVILVASGSYPILPNPPKAALDLAPSRRLCPPSFTSNGSLILSVVSLTRNCRIFRQTGSLTEPPLSLLHQPPWPHFSPPLLLSRTPLSLLPMARLPLYFPCFANPTFPRWRPLQAAVWSLHLPRSIPRSAARLTPFTPPLPLSLLLSPINRSLHLRTTLVPLCFKLLLPRPWRISPSSPSTALTLSRRCSILPTRPTLASAPLRNLLTLLLPRRSHPRRTTPRLRSATATPHKHPIPRPLRLVLPLAMFPLSLALTATRKETAINEATAKTRTPTPPAPSISRALTTARRASLRIDYRVFAASPPPLNLVPLSQSYSTLEAR